MRPVFTQTRTSGRFPFLGLCKFLNVGNLSRPFWVGKNGSPLFTHAQTKECRLCLSLRKLLHVGDFKSFGFASVKCARLCLRRLRQRDIFFVWVCVKTDYHFTDPQENELKSPTFRNLHRLRQREISLCLGLCKFLNVWNFKASSFESEKCAPLSTQTQTEEYIHLSESA